MVDRGGLENRCGPTGPPWVRIPPSPPSPLKKHRRPLEGDASRIPPSPLTSFAMRVHATLSAGRRIPDALLPAINGQVIRCESANGLRQRSLSSCWAISFFNRSPFIVRSPLHLSRHCGTIFVAEFLYKKGCCPGEHSTLFMELLHCRPRQYLR